MKKFNEFVKQIEESFIHKAEIPKEFGMAVYRVMHNQASKYDWDNLDKYPRNQALDWIKSILIDNKTPENQLQKELDWWQRQLVTIDN